MRCSQEFQMMVGEGPRGVLLNAVPGLHAECAALLRHREALPHAAGRVLAEWLEEQAEEG